MEWFSTTSFRVGLDLTLIFFCTFIVLYIRHRNYSRLKQLIYQTRTAVFLVSKQSGQILDANQAAMTLLGIRQVGQRFLLPSTITHDALLDMIQSDRSQQIWAISSNNHKSISLITESAKFNRQQAWIVHASPVDNFHQNADTSITDIDPEAHAQFALDSLSELIFCTDLDNRVTGKNKAYKQFWLGREKEGCALLDFDILKGKAVHKRWTTTVDGESCLLETHFRPLTNAHGEVIGGLGITHDVTKWFVMQESISEEATQRQTIEVELAQRESLLQSVLLSAPDPIAIFDENYICEVCNQPYAESLGIADKDMIIGQCLDNILPESLVGRFRKTDLEVIEKGKTLRFIDKIQKTTNEVIWYDVLKAPYHDPFTGSTGYLLIARDITERLLAEQKLAQVNVELEALSFFDKLTKISNKRRFDSQLNALWALHLRQQRPLTIIMCELDNLKSFNDSYGSQVGDELLIQMASDFTNITQRGADLVARYSETQFIFLLPETNQAGSMTMAEYIHQVAANLSLVVDSSPQNQLTTSLGLVSLIPERELPPEFAVELVEQALSDAKKSGGNQTKVSNYQTSNDVGPKNNENSK